MTVPGGLVDGGDGADDTKGGLLPPESCRGHRVNTRGTMSSVPGVLLATSRILAILSGTLP